MTAPTFADLGVSEAVRGALKKSGAAIPFPVQSLVIPDALAGRDVLARSRTGSGKTIAFSAPIVERLQPGTKRPGALVLVPTRELAVQVVKAMRPLARARGLEVGAAYGGVSIREQAREVGGADILVATPGRLDDLMNRRLVNVSSVRILVLDEADRMLDMGFLPQVDAIVRHVPADRQTLFLSATLDGQVAQLAQRFTRSPVRHEVHSDQRTVDEAEHLFVAVDAEGLGSIQTKVGPDTFVVVEKWANLEALKGHAAAAHMVAYGAKVSGCTVHFADNEYDHGPIILQRAVPVLGDDTPDTLAARVFAEECRLYPEAIRLFAAGRLTVEGRQVKILAEVRHER